ncbi:hypothetical protein V6Z11_A05G198800 [Gossypium hirsutum]
MDSSIFTKAWVDTAGSGGIKDYHAIKRWQSQAAAADPDFFHPTVHVKDEEESNTSSRQPTWKHDERANKRSISQVAVSKERFKNDPREADHIKHAVVVYVGSLLMPLYKARKIDKDGNKSIMKKTATKVLFLAFLLSFRFGLVGLSAARKHVSDIYSQIRNCGLRLAPCGALSVLFKTVAVPGPTSSSRTLAPSPNNFSFYKRQKWRYSISQTTILGVCRTSPSTSLQSPTVLIVLILRKMAEEINKSEIRSSPSIIAKSRSLWPSVLRWIPTSTDHIIASEKRLLSLVKTLYVQELVNIGSGPPGSKVRWFRSSSNEPRFINTVTFDSKEGSPTLVMVHGYAASQGFFFKNFDYLANRFKVIAIDQLGWGGSSRPDFTCKSTEETEAWFIDSLEEWRKAKNLSNFILLGHSFGGYVAAKYALKHPEHVQHLILVGTAGLSSESDTTYEWVTRFRATWRGAILSHLWESNFTPQKIIRGLGPWGPDLVRKYTAARFTNRYSPEGVFTEEESRLLSDYVYHTSAAKASGELCLKYIFAFGAFNRALLNSASEWKVPTTFIYGAEDWMNYQGAQEAREQMKVPCEIIRVPQGGHFVFLENRDGFHSAVLYACRRFLSPNPDKEPFPEGLVSA